MQRGAEVALSLEIGIVGQEQAYRSRVVCQDRALEIAGIGRRRLGQERGQQEREQSGHDRFAKVDKGIASEHSISTRGQK